MAKEKKGTKKGGKRREKRSVPHGVAHIRSTFNNTLVTISDPEGNAISWSSAGRIGFKGSRKGTPFAAQVAGQNAAQTARDTVGMRSVDVLVRGPGGGRESAVRAIQSAGIDVKSIRDVTPIPHNGTRPRKRRRV
jgi:small subunit ribosomal protein S11